MSETERQESPAIIHKARKLTRQKNESDVLKIFLTKDYRETKSMSRQTRRQGTATQSSFFSKSTIASWKDPRPTTHFTDPKNRETRTQFFTPIHTQYTERPSTIEPPGAAVESDRLNSVEASTPKKNVQFFQGGSEKSQRKIHRPNFSSDRPQGMEVLSSTTSRTRDTSEKPQSLLSTRGLSSNKRQRLSSIEDSLTESAKTQYDIDDDDKINLKLLTKAMAAPALEKLNQRSKPIDPSQKPMVANTGSLDRLRKDHSAFIKTNFKEANFSRLKTFEKFAFTRVERDDHKDIVPILEDLRSFKERAGTMFVTDLWPRTLQQDVLLENGMLQEKRKLEKFAFYKTMQKAKTKKTDMQFLVINNKNERVLKDILFRKQLKEDFLARQSNQLIEELELKKKNRRSPFKLSSMFKNTVSTDQARVKNLLLKIYQLENENKNDYRILKDKFHEQGSWVQRMRQNKTVRDLDEEKLDSLRKLKNLII